MQCSCALQVKFTAELTPEEVEHMVMCERDEATDVAFLVYGCGNKVVTGYYLDVCFNTDAMHGRLTKEFKVGTNCTCQCGGNVGLWVDIPAGMLVVAVVASAKVEHEGVAYDDTMEVETREHVEQQFNSYRDRIRSEVYMERVPAAEEAPAEEAPAEEAEQFIAPNSYDACWNMAMEELSVMKNWPKACRLYKLMYKMHKLKDEGAVNPPHPKRAKVVEFGKQEVYVDGELVFGGSSSSGLGNI